MWTLLPNDAYVRRAKHWPNKHKREFAAVHDNLDGLLLSLNAGATMEEACKRGFVHPEPRGVIAIDQKGGGAGLKETRLYVYLDKGTEIAHLVTLGCKSEQRSDVKYACDFVDGLIAERR